MKTSNKILLGGVAFLSLCFISFLIALRANSTENEITKGSGNIVKFSQPVEPFHKMSISGGFEVVLTKGEGHSLEIEVDDEMKQFISAEVKEGELIVRYTEHNLDFTKDALYITVDSLSEMSFSGSVDMETNGIFESERFKITSNGACDVSFAINAPYVEAYAYGSAETSLMGKGEYVQFHAGGAGEIHAREFEASVAKIEGNGSSFFQVHVSDSMHVSLGGSSDLEYKGSPRMNSRTSGSSGMRSIQ